MEKTKRKWTRRKPVVKEGELKKGISGIGGDGGNGLPATLANAETQVGFAESHINAETQVGLAGTLFPGLTFAAESAPEDVQPAFARVLQVLIAQGLPDIAPPRNTRELSTLIDLWRKLSKLDKVEAQGPASLVAPMRSLARRTVAPITLEAETPEPEPWDEGDGLGEDD